MRVCAVKPTFLWRRKRDLNPRAGFPTYSLSRGAPSPLGYFSKMLKHNYYDRHRMNSANLNDHQTPLSTSCNNYITERKICQGLFRKNLHLLLRLSKVHSKIGSICVFLQNGWDIMPFAKFQRQCCRYIIKYTNDQCLGCRNCRRFCAELRCFYG